jgi:hypothetical protein
MPSWKNLVCIVLFLVVVFVGDRLVALGARKIIQHSQNDFVRMYEGHHPAQIIFLGDSQVDRNIDFQMVEQLTRKITLNLGLGGNHVLISEALLKDYVHRYGNPELVIIELSHSTVVPDKMGEMGIFSIYSSHIAALAKSIDPTLSTFETVFWSLRFNNPTFWRLSAEVFDKPSSRLLHNTIPAVLVSKWKGDRKFNRRIIQGNMEAINRICNYVDLRQIQIRLLIAPYWKGFRGGIANFESWKSALQKAAGRHHVYDYSELFSEHSDYFNDEIHLNATGADLFLRKLMEDKVLELTDRPSFR